MSPRPAGCVAALTRTRFLDHTGPSQAGNQGLVVDWVLFAYTAFFLAPVLFVVFKSYSSYFKVRSEPRGSRPTTASDTRLAAG